MIGVTVAWLLSCASFLLGILWMHWHADYAMLWQSTAGETEALAALRYYTTAVGSWPDGYLTSLAMVGFGQVAMLLFQISFGKEINWLFDGASLFLVISMAILFKTKLLPFVASIPSLGVLKSVESTRLSTATFVSLREVASAHVLMTIALLGILLLQCGKYYSERLQDRERNEEVDARVLRRLRQLQQEERVRNGIVNPSMAPSAGGPETST